MLRDFWGVPIGRVDVAGAAVLRIWAMKSLFVVVVVDLVGGGWDGDTCRNKMRIGSRVVCLHGFTYTSHDLVWVGLDQESCNGLVS